MGEFIKIKSMLNPADVAKAAGLSTTRGFTFSNIGRDTVCSCIE